MTENPDEINDSQRLIEQTLWKEGMDYAERNKRSKEENKGRAESRARVKHTGINTNAYHTAVKLIKDLSAKEREQWLSDLKLTLKVLGSRQAELFPEEALKIAKREEDKKRREAEAKTKAGVDADTNPRSDPNKGGAKPQTIKEAAVASDAAIAESIKVVGAEAGEMKSAPGTEGTPPNPPGEQDEGAKVLQMNQQPKSQSQIAREKLDALGMESATPARAN